MHGLINRSIQLFVCHTVGRDQWSEVVRTANVGRDDFEGMLSYEDSETFLLLDAVAQVLVRPKEEVLEDLGTFLVAHSGFGAVRRLLRFSGEDFVEFLHALDDLDERVRLAVPALCLPKLELLTRSDGVFSLRCGGGLPGYASVLMGVLRAMADEYGALVLLGRGEGAGSEEEILIELVVDDFNTGRRFELGVGA